MPMQRHRRLRAIASHVAADADTVAQLQEQWAASRAETARIEAELAAANAPFAPDSGEKVAPMAGVTVLEVANWAAPPRPAPSSPTSAPRLLRSRRSKATRCATRWRSPRSSTRYAFSTPNFPLMFSVFAEDETGQETDKNFLPGEVIDPEFNFANRGKKSICVNVGDPAGIAIVHKLAVTTQPNHLSVIFQKFR